jgi:hypothetical protein
MPGNEKDPSRRILLIQASLQCGVRRESIQGQSGVRQNFGHGATDGTGLRKGREKRIAVAVEDSVSMVNQQQFGSNSASVIWLKRELSRPPEGLRLSNLVESWYSMGIRPTTRKSSEAI